MNNARYSLIILLLLLVAAGTPSLAQKKADENPNVEWKLLTPAVSAAPGASAEVKVRAKIAKGSHLYSLKAYPADALAPQNTVITAGEKDLLSLGKVRTPAPTKKYDENFEIETEFWENEVTFTIPVKIAAKAKPGEQEGWVQFYFMTCNDQSCMPPTEKKLAFKVTVAADSTTASADTAAADTAATASADTAAAADSTLAAKHDSGTGNAAITAAPPTSGDQNGPTDESSQKRKEGSLAYILWAAAGGLLALMTPCVFPMVPITVSFFTKRKHISRARSVRDASIYSLGIILTFTAIGFVASLLLGPAGLNQIAAHPAMNLFIAAIFVILALNLFGMFEIQVPTSLINRLNKKSMEGDGILSILLMSLVFTLTSFTCTVAVVSGILMSVSGGDWLVPLFAMLAFSTVFAAPFFVLALFPSLMKSLPQSGGWLNAVKVVMGFIETAAAIKFLSNADLVLGWGLFTREFFLAIWIAIAVLITVYLLGRFQLPHDTPVEKVGPLRALLATSFLALGFWLLTGLFGGRLGEVDALIPPQEYPGKGNTSILASLSGTLSAAPSSGSDKAAGHGDWNQDNYARAVAEAKKSGKPIFIDFTGYTCTNCRWMELNMFTRNEVSDLMRNYVLLRLYTDRPDSVNRWNRKLQISQYNTIELPYYALITPEGKTISARGWTRNADEFVTFLKRGLGNGKQALAER